MSGIGKIFVVLNLVFSLVIVGAAAAYLSKSDEWKQKYDTLDATYQEEKDDWDQLRSDLNTSVKNLEDERNDKQNKIEDLELKADRVANELKTEETNNQQLRDDVTKIQNNLDDFQTNLNDVNSRNSELVDQNADLRTQALNAKEGQRLAEENLIRVQGEVEALQEQIASLEERVTTANEDRDHLANVLTVAKQQGFDISSIVAVPEVTAYIQEVNNELGFVILSVGSDDNVKKGYKFSVYRDKTYLGEVQVSDVYADRCAARIIEPTVGQFQVNDKAATIL